MGDTLYLYILSDFGQNFQTATGVAVQTGPAASLRYHQVLAMFAKK
jgi:hypothetical protein